MKAIKHLLLALLMLPVTGFAQTYTLTLLQQPTQCGTVYGAGNYESGTNVSVNATPNSYYSFVGWYEGSNMISSERSFTYEMPEHDVTLTARYSYTPTLPGEPEAPGSSEPETTYTVELAAVPSAAAQISTSSFTQAPGTTIWINPSVSSYFTFKEWRNDLDEVVSTERAFTFTVPERDTKLTAYFYYNPSTPADPGSFNSWDPFTGELMILKLSSLQNACDELISTNERPLVKKLVVADPDFNDYDYNINYIRNYLTSVEVVDLKDTQFNYYNSSSLQIPSLKKVVLPAGTRGFHSSAFSVENNAALEEIWIYAATPVSSGASVLDNIPATCIIYVPNESVEAYQTSSYWSSHDIRPMVSEENAVGPGDAAWNDLNQLHKLPFNYTYSGADSGSIEYMVEETGEWQTLCADLENGREIDTYALAQFIKSRSTHTIDFRVIDGETVTPLPEKRVALIDMGFKTVTVAGSNFYDYGNAIEPAVTVADLASDRYVVAYTNNYKVGRASALAAGMYPYSINTRSATFDITRLPLPGSVEFVDPEVSLVYTGSYIRPDWRFTDPRNEALVKNTDYTVAWSNSYNAGIQTLTITGKGQFDGSIVYEYEILKGPVLSQAYTYGITYPDSEILYDGAAHGIIKSSFAPHSAYSGEPIIEYYDHETGDKLDSAPTELGEYEAWLGFEEGPNTVYTAPVCKTVYTIFDMEDSEWEAIQALSADLATHGYVTGWDLSEKIKSLRYTGVTVKKGRLTEINLPNKSMIGTFPESLYAFSHMKRINLSGNRLSGSFDTETRTLGAVEYVDLTGNIISGDLTKLAARFPAATTIKVSGNRLSTVSDLLPETVETLEIGGQTTSATVDMDYTGASLETFYTSLPSIARYDHAGRTFTSTPDLWLTTSAYTSVAQLPAASWAMKLTDDGVEKVSDNVVYSGDNGTTVHVLTADNTLFDIAFTFRPGDTNFDRLVSVLDLQGIINCIFDEINPEAPFNGTAADIKADGAVNIFDVTTIVDAIINTPPSAAQIRRVHSAETCILAYCSDGKLVISSAEPVAAFDIALAVSSLPKQIPQLDAMGFNYSVSDSRIVAYSLSGATLPPGVTAIADLDGEASVVYAELVNNRARAITQNAETTGIGSIVADDADRGDWYNLQGARIPRPTAPGIYIHNNKKIIIR